MYGIGRFSGIKNIETNGVTKDYITIKYAGTDVLYVPVTQLDLVSIISTLWSGQRHETR